MISCRQARHLFDAFLDDELSPAMRAELHTHRLSCPDCSQELALLEACADVVASDRREPVLHEDFTDRVLVAFAGRKPVPSYRWRRIAVFAGSPLAAAAVLVFAFTAWFHQPAPVHKVLGGTKGAVRLPDSLLPDVMKVSHTLTPEQQAELAKLEPLQAKDVLAAWLSPAVERANNLLSQTQDSASQLANFVRLGILPPDVRVVELPQQTPTESADLGDDPTKPRFDNALPGDEHLGQPESTDKTTTNDIEVM